MFSSGTIEAADCRHSFLNPDISIRNYSGVRPFSGGSDPFKRHLTTAEVQKCLHRLYVEPVQHIREERKAENAEIDDQLLRMKSPADHSRLHRHDHHHDYHHHHHQVSATSAELEAAHGVDAMPDEARSRNGLSPSKFAEKFYTQRLAVGAAHRAALERKYAADGRGHPDFTMNLKSRKLSPEDEQAYIERMYYKQPTKEQVAAATEKKVFGGLPPRPQSKFETHEAQKVAVKRLYDDRLALLKRRNQDREEKYGWRSRGDRDGSNKKRALTGEALTEMLKRLGSPTTAK